LYALKNHRQRLCDVHQLAQEFTRGLFQLKDVSIDPASVETNIVRFELKDRLASEFVEEAHRRGLYMLPTGARAVRAVFYLDISPADAARAIEIVRETIDAVPRALSPSTIARTPSCAAPSSTY